MDNFFETNRTNLENFRRVSGTVGARADYVQGGGGNTSVKLDGGLMAIKASGYCLKDIDVDKAYAVLDYVSLRDFYNNTDPKTLDDVEKTGSERAKASIQTIEGLAALRPSVEAGFHSLLDRFVAHSHSVYANLATCAEDGRAVVARALEGADYTWGFVPYTDPGARLTFSIRDELARVEKETGKRPAVIFMQNHGLIAHNDDADECLRIHSDCNARIAAAFGVKDGDFPAVSVREIEGGLVEAVSPLLSDCLKSGEYTEKFLLESAAVSRSAGVPDRLLRLRRESRGGHVRRGSGHGPRRVQHAGSQGADHRRDADLRGLHRRDAEALRPHPVHHGRGRACVHRQLGEREVSQISGGQEIRKFEAEESAERAFSRFL